MREREADPADHRAGQRSDERHPEFDLRAGGVLLDLGDAAQGKQRDFLHGQFVRGSHQRVRQLMQQQRDEEEKSGRNRQGQDDAVAPIRIVEWNCDESENTMRSAMRNQL